VVLTGFLNRSFGAKKRTGEELQLILKEIFSLSRPQDFPRKIMLLQHALILVQHKSNPKFWAILQGELGYSLYQNPLGNRRDNIEKAIECYNKALEVFTFQAFPAQWVKIHSDLADIYKDRTEGKRAENIEKAIEHYNYALKVQTQKDFPVEWATTLNKLAGAYGIRILGNRVENIEKVIQYCNQILVVITDQDLSVERASAHNNLGNAYRERIKGDRVENIEKAIKHFTQALKVYNTRSELLILWAETMNNLANTYRERIRGDQVENIEKAIECYTQSFLVHTYKDFPVKWALTQNNLGVAYSDRILGDNAENIEKAIEHYNEALKVIKKQNEFQEDWAGTQNNLATAYKNRIKGDRAKNIEKAIEHCNNALGIYTPQDFPEHWAMTQHNLANAYSDRIYGDKIENIEQAIEHYKNALGIYTHNDSPINWAGIQNSLGNAYRDRIKGNRADNIEKAINHYRSALGVYKLGSMPNEFRMTCNSLGDLYRDKDQWKDAIESYKGAIKVGDLFYHSALSMESKIVEVGKNAYIYRNAAFAACRLGQTEEALLILEKGKNRVLNEALRLKMKQLEGIPTEEWVKYEQAAEKYRNATRHSDRKEDYAQREKEVRKALNELNSAVKIMQRYNPEFQKELKILDVLSILDEETALLTFCITNKGSMGFTLSKSNGLQLVDISDFKTEDLNSLLFKFNGQGILTGGWVGNYISYLNAFKTYNYCNKEHKNKGTSETERQLLDAGNRYEEAFQAWQVNLDSVLFQIGAKLLDPLLEKLSPQIKRLILLPSGGLFLLPLHAAPLPTGEFLCQHYCISYAPSIELLRQMKSKAETVEGESLYAVINPQEDSSLVFSGCEGQAISKFFKSPQVNIGEIGTWATVVDLVPGYAYVHFSCHGSYNWNDPPQSGLYLVGGRTLSLADLQNNEVDMSSARLVTLSACETGITDIFKGSTDEFVGLPAGFMLAGVPCVVSSLWSVPDISTALLMERFYSNHIAGGMNIPMALQDAQLWVRELTSTQIVDFVEKCYHSGKWEGKSKE
jgi:CHAT domain-containing protein